MQLKPHFFISSRLMAAVKISDAVVSIEILDTITHDGRDVYNVWIDLPSGEEFNITDIQSGCQGGTLQKGMASLLSFLGAAAEAYAHRIRIGDMELYQDSNESLFVPAVVEWAAQNSDEIACLACELEENKELILE